MGVLQTPSFPLRHPVESLYFIMQVANFPCHMLHSVTMKTVKIILISVVSLIILTGTAFYLVGLLSPKQGGIRIETTPKATVFVNGSLVGETPFTGMYKAGAVILRLVPTGSSENLVPFETSITLTPGIETFVGRNFGTSEDTSSGRIISFEKTGAQSAGLVVISQPDNAQVLVDGVSRGFSPYSASAIAPAMHTISIKAPGYSDLSMTVKTLTGYRLTFYAKLERTDSQNTDSIKESLKTEIKIVQILETPTGYLRVRSKPGAGGEEIAQVKPGETFPYLDTDAATGWIEIQYGAPKPGLPSGIVGWISADYATVSAVAR